MITNIEDKFQINEYRIISRELRGPTSEKYEYLYKFFAKEKSRNQLKVYERALNIILFNNVNELFLEDKIETELTTVKYCLREDGFPPKHQMIELVFHSLSS